MMFTGRWAAAQRQANTLALPPRVAIGTLGVIAAVSIPIAASASPAVPPLPAPHWSGIDARNYNGTVAGPHGSLITARPLDTAVTLRESGNAIRMLYSTIDQHQRLATSTGQVFTPKGTAPEGGWPVIAWAHGTVGMGDDCAPSAQAHSAEESAYLNHWLHRGYAIVATDYAGQGTPGLLSYLNSQGAAHSVVDSLTAARQSGVPLSRKWFALGHSEGAAAALSTARYAREFSSDPSLDFRGVVATGVPANLESIIQYGGPQFPPVILPRSLNGYLLYILAGLRDARPDLNLNAILTRRGQRLVTVAEQSCGHQLRPYAQNLDLRTLFRRPLMSIPHMFQALQSYLGVPTTGYRRPILIGQGLVDVNVPAPAALSLSTQLAANHQPLELKVFPAADHAGVLRNIVNDADRFVARIMK